MKDDKQIKNPFDPDDDFLEQARQIADSLNESVEENFYANLLYLVEKNIAILDNQSKNKGKVSVLIDSEKKLDNN